MTDVGKGQKRRYNSDCESHSVRTYKAHCQVYKHKELCRLENCRDTNHTHPPICPRGRRCRFRDQTHPDGIFYSHMLRPCPDGTFCSKWNDEEHMASFSHVFKTPCREPMYCQLLKNGPDLHFEEYSHLCPYGRNCQELLGRLNWYLCSLGFLSIFGGREMDLGD